MNTMDYLSGNPCLKVGFDETAAVALRDPIIHSKLP